LRSGFRYSDRRKREHHEAAGQCCKLPQQLMVPLRYEGYCLVEILGQLCVFMRAKFPDAILNQEAMSGQHLSKQQQRNSAEEETLNNRTQTPGRKMSGSVTAVPTTT
jgi:hypothetical protein